MRRALFGICVLIGLTACVGGGPIAEFWRPVSEPNTLLSLDKAQMKLDFDLSQCNCGIYPANVPQPALQAFQPGEQRIAQTSITRTMEPGEGCMQRPSLVVAECMRARGWEVTKCSGRMPTVSGGALCAGTQF